MFSSSVGQFCPHCGKPFDDAKAKGFIDGRYVPVREIGSGSMGTVQLARDPALGRDVAIKLIAAPLRDSFDATAAFYREASALASVRHDNVVQVHAFGMHGDSCYFAMEFIHGTSLDRILRSYRMREERIPVHRALAILRRVADGLAAVHGAGLVHCDVKPSNIVIESATGRPVLVDFGIAVRADPPTFSSDPPVGTPPYMAPEQVIPGSQLSPQTDVYGLGCTAYELLTGEPPFVSDQVTSVLQGQVRHAPPPVSRVSRRLVPLDPLIQRALAKNPSDRFDSARALARSLDGVISRFDSGGLLHRHVATTPVEDDTPTRPAPALRVLIVDDDKDFTALVQLAVEAAFRGMSTQVTVANSGEDALRRTQTAPSLVVLDRHMPGLDGIETLSLLRERTGGSAMRVLVVSGSADAEARARFGLLGVTEFCNKPIAFGELVTRLEQVIAQNRWRR